MGVPDASDSRLTALTEWVVECLGFTQSRIEPASADASFRRYFRITRGVDTYIVMDAPPDKENVGPFVSVARSMAGMGLNVPIVLARDEEQGFLLLTDLGSRQYLDELNAGREVDRLYQDALDALVILQSRGESAARNLHPYDSALLRREMELLPEWFMQWHLGSTVGPGDRAVLDRTFDVLVRAALEQPTVFVHRDYHSRNLLVCDGPPDEATVTATVTATAAVAVAAAGRRNPGILDFQDAVLGPITYDAVSLLKDCYIAWPENRVRGWLSAYRGRLRDAGVAVPGDESDFVRWFDLMGLQRHIKVLGIFARLFYRDAKPGYIKDLPRVLDYVRHTAAMYPETAELAEFVRERIDPGFAVAQARVLGAIERAR
jgi:aminoglycoside/choline kinase family phosphotransferase